MTAQVVSREPGVEETHGLAEGGKCRGDAADVLVVKQADVGITSYEKYR